MRDWTDIEPGFDRTIRDSVLGEPVTYTSSNGTPRGIRGVFSPTSVEVDPETQALVRTNRPTLGVILSDLENDPEDGDDFDEVTVRGVEYRVVEVERIGADDILGPSGWAELRLHLKNP